MSEIGKINVSERDATQLRCMLNGATELSNFFERCSAESCDPQIRDEMQKFAAESRNHKAKLADLADGNSC
jgi:hypothetical protein